MIRLLKIALVLLGVPVFILSVLGLFWLANNPANPSYAYMLYPILVGIYLSTIPFYIALYQAFKILINIDKDNALSKQCARALKNIKLCAIAVSILYTGILPLVFLIAQKDDAPGLIVFGTIPIFISLVIAIFAAVFQALFGNIMDMSLDNELIVLDGQTIKR